MSLLENLNPAQKEAVIWPANVPLLVIAGAGSGKTRILTRRIAYLISQGVSSFQILGVTFTNKAAGEMKQRVQKLVQQEVWISTFHSACLRILRMDGPAIDIDKRFTIYDDQDQLTLIKECLKELNLNEKQVHPKGVRERIQRAKDLLTTPFQYAEKAPDPYEEQVAKVYERYEEKLARLRGLDFGDLIMKTVALFDRRPDVLAGWQDRLRFILIDEYQDTNHAQYRFVKLLAGRHKQITVVGDPDQSIYAWRGADIRNILSFENDYPDCGVIRMEQNYRSTPVILDAANELIGHNRMRKPKALWTEHRGGEAISIAECTDEKEEAAYVVRQVKAARAKGKNLGDQVVFYRVHAQSRPLEDALRKAKIPYKIVGGIRFYDRREIKDLIAYLRAVAFPHDDLSLKRILNVPARGIGKKTQEVLEAEIGKSAPTFDEVLKAIGSDLRSDPKGKTILGSDLRSDPLGFKTKKTIAEFYTWLQALRKEKAKLSVSGLLELILEKTGYVEALKEEKTLEAEARIENIEEFFSVVQDFEEEYSEIASPEARNDVIANEAESHDSSPSLRVPHDSCGTKQSRLEAFLESISLITDLDTWQGSTDVLTLMTLHTAKGLEFPVVFIVGMEEGLFPNVNAYTGDSSDLEEERRLCYVGLTRAKEKIHLTYTVQRRIYGSMARNLPSRFLHEIPAELLTSQGGHRILADDPRDPDFSVDENRILFD